MGLVKNPWEPVQTYSNTQTPRLRRELPVQSHKKASVRRCSVPHRARPI